MMTDLKSLLHPIDIHVGSFRGLVIYQWEETNNALYEYVA